MELRTACLADVAAIASVHAASWRSSYRGALNDIYLDGDTLLPDRVDVWRQRLASSPPNQHVVVAEHAAVIAGFACVYAGADPERGALLDTIHLAPEYKRHGIGTRLMTDVACWCLQADPDRGLYLWVLEKNLPARRFYKRLGGCAMDAAPWSPPGGGQAQRLRYVWERSGLLATAN